MRSHYTVVGALKAAESSGDGCGEFWVNWLTEPLRTAHLRNENLGAPGKDELRMRNDERSRMNGLCPRDRLMLSEELANSLT